MKSRTKKKLSRKRLPSTTRSNVRAIIVAIDHELERSRRSFITVVEANALLARKGLLTDYAWDFGRALRVLLRMGAIPHAYKLSGHTSGQWVIPHSSLRRPLDKPEKNYSKR